MSAIVRRLTDQLAAKGVKDAEATAIAQLKRFGILDESGNLTAYGETRNAMSPAQRAIDRASKYAGKSPGKYKYDARTNTATLR